MGVLASFSMESAFMPHGHCYYWEPFILWTHAISDSIIALAYFVIPLTLVKIVKRRKDFQYVWVVTLFAVFILGCGATHVMDVINIWTPFYWTDSVIRMITALASVGTALMLIFITPKLILIPSAEQWKQINEELTVLNEHLEQKVSERTLALNESSATFKFLTDAIPQIVWSSKANGKIDYYNKNWYNYTGLGTQENDTQAWEKVIHPQDLLNINETWVHSLETGETFEMEYRIKNAQDGAYRWHLGRSVAMKDEQGKVTKWFGTATDIHDQKKKREELKRVNEELDNFVYTASHDLKAPITNLEGLMTLIQERTPETATEQLQPLHFMMDKQVDKLKMIIHDLADVGRIEKGKVEDFREVDIAKLVSDFITSHQSTAATFNARILTELNPVSVFFTPFQLRTLLFNLLDNAVKYSDPTQVTEIRVSSGYQGDCWVLEVKDNGEGIPEAYHSKIFEMFKRYNRHANGTGMGLYIVKRIVEKYQGNVEVSSEVGRGSTFTIKLPDHLVKVPVA